MKFSEDNIKDKPIFIIEEKPEVTPEQAAGETPVITIETDGEAPHDVMLSLMPRRRWPWIVGTAVATTLICLCMAATYGYYRTYINIGVPVSVTSKQNIAKLRQTASTGVPAEVIMTTDSILGVGFNLYELRGLRGEVSFAEPEKSDADVFLYSRCSDFSSYDKAANHYLGSLVVNGDEIEANNTRLGYCAMAHDNIVIGVARDERVKDYCIEQGGSFFRQFILISNGELPPVFYLHGKVERRALGRMGDRLYYIESRGREAMWAFADALREYGFIDAIYITGGADRCFYRDAEGVPHDIGDSSREAEKHRGRGIVPWMVFKKR